MRQIVLCLCALAAFAAHAAIPASEQAVAVEFYNAALDHYFISADPGEINDLDTGVHVGWTRAGYRFAVMKSGSTYAGTVPVCRFFSEKLSSHFYSAKVSECNDVIAKFSDTWLFEASEVFRAFLVDPATGACPADTTPVYRLYNNRADANHRYTDQLQLFVFMKAKGYIAEGDGKPAFPVAFCTPAGGDVVPQAPANAPRCTLTPSNATPAPGSAISITATCSNNPTTFLWIGCGGTLSICSASQAAPGSTTYTLYTANAQAPGVPATTTVTWTTAAPPPPPPPPTDTPPTCSLAASPRFPAVNTSLTLTATCSHSPSSYSWFACDPTNQNNCAPIPGCSGSSSTCVVTASTPVTVRYFVSATNNLGAGPPTQTYVEWQNSAAFGGFCGQYVRVKEFGLPWGDGSRYLTATYGSFTAETVMVMALTVPGNVTTLAIPGATTIYEFGGPTTLRLATVSDTPCDFRSQDPTGASGPYVSTGGTQATITWNVGSAGGAQVALQPGKTYYFNFRNFNCADTCDAGIETLFPH